EVDRPPLTPSKMLTEAPCTADDAPACVMTPSNVNVGAAATLTCSVPVRLWYVARMSVSPDPVPITVPEEETVATDAAVDCQLAWLETFCVVPLEQFAVAVNCEEAPIARLVPPAPAERSVR